MTEVIAPKQTVVAQVVDENGDRIKMLYEGREYKGIVICCGIVGSQAYLRTPQDCYINDARIARKNESNTLKVANFQNGNIIVAYQTEPPMVSMMRRSGGFVTDEGGMLSHAAVCGRDFFKPAIVGTKVATKEIQDAQRIAMRWKYLTSQAGGKEVKAQVGYVIRLEDVV